MRSKSEKVWIAGTAQLPHRYKPAQSLVRWYAHFSQKNTQPTAGRLAGKE